MRPSNHRDPVVLPPARLQGLDGHWIVRIADGRIAGVMPTFLNAATPERRLVPMFADGHMHLGLWATFLASVDLRGAESPEICARRVTTATRRHEEGRWILGRGFDVNRFPVGASFDADLLEAASPKHPVYLAAHDEHAAWVNRRALAAAGIDRSTPDPYGGRIVRDARGEATGYLIENATALVKRVLPQRTLEMWKDDLLLAQQDLLARGVLVVQDVDPDTEEGLRALDDEGKLRLHVATAIPSKDLRRAIRDGRRTGEGSSHLRLGGVKWFVDGSLGSRTAAMKAPWSDRPGDTGTWLIPESRLLEELELAHAAGLRPLIHAIGDAAVERVLRCLEKTGPWPADLRPRVEHAQTVADEDVDLFVRSGATASMQPCHLATDHAIAAKALGDRTHRLFRCRTLSDRGVPLLLGTDAPVEPPDPLVALHFAVHRRHPATPETPAFHPEEGLSEDAALHAMTRSAATEIGFPEALPAFKEGAPARCLLLERPHPSAPWTIAWSPDPTRDAL